MRTDDTDPIAEAFRASYRTMLHDTPTVSDRLPLPATTTSVPVRRGWLVAVAAAAVVAAVIGVVGLTNQRDPAPIIDEPRQPPIEDTVPGPSEDLAQSPETSTPEPATTTPSVSTAGAEPSLEVSPVSPDAGSSIAILASIPTDVTVDEMAAELTSRDLESASVLRSDGYASLTPGFWVVFDGPFPSTAEAESACEARRAQVPDCYVRTLQRSGDGPIGFEHGTIVGTRGTDGQMVVVDVTTGETIRTLDAFSVEAGWYLGVQIDVDGTALYAQLGIEDSWFSCEASVGRIDRLDLATGDIETIGDGFDPDLDQSDTRLLTIEASQCGPDAANADFVVAEPDTVVVRDLEDGSVERFAIEEADRAGAPLDGVVWAQENVAYYTAGERIGALDTVTGDAVLLDGRLPENYHEVVGYDPVRDDLLVVEYDNDSNRVLWVDPNGDASSEIVFEAMAPVSAALDRTGRHLAISTDDRLIVDGTDVPHDGEISVIAW